MEKSKKAKLLELRAKKIENNKVADQKKHEEIIEALNALHGLFSDGNVTSTESTEQLLDKLSEIESLKSEVASVRQAIENIPKIEKVAISNLSELISQQKEVDLSRVVNAINTLTREVKSQTVNSITVDNKEPADFIPTRRVINKNGTLVFDDKPMEVTVVGGGGRGASMASVQAPLIRDGNAIAVVNQDGTPMNGGFSPEADVTTVIDGDIITQTDGVKTLTTTISGNTITEVWT